MSHRENCTKKKKTLFFLFRQHKNSLNLKWRMDSFSYLKREQNKKKTEWKSALSVWIWQILTWYSVLFTQFDIFSLSRALFMTVLKTERWAAQRQCERRKRVNTRWTWTTKECNEGLRVCQIRANSSLVLTVPSSPYGTSTAIYCHTYSHKNLRDGT